MKNLIKDIIKPENSTEEKIINDHEFIEGALWGKPRNGHPEGQVIYHINEVLANVNKYSNGEERSDLRIVAIIHDTFKNKVDITKPKYGENHHAMIARRFAEKYITDKVLLDIIELHDEAYNSYSIGIRKNDWLQAEKRAKALIKRLGDNIDLFIKFYKCDGETGDKKAGDFNWFINLI